MSKGNSLKDLLEALKTLTQSMENQQDCDDEEHDHDCLSTGALFKKLSRLSASTEMAKMKLANAVSEPYYLAYLGMMAHLSGAVALTIYEKSANRDNSEARRKVHSIMEEIKRFLDICDKKFNECEKHK